MLTSIIRNAATCWRAFLLLRLMVAAPLAGAGPVTVDDWIARLTVFYAAVAIMIVVDGVALYFILGALRRVGGDGRRQ